MVTHWEILKDKHRKKRGRSAALLLLAESDPEGGDQPGQGAAQAVRAIGDAVKSEGQGENE